MSSLSPHCWTTRWPPPSLFSWGSRNSETQCNLWPNFPSLPRRGAGSIKRGAISPQQWAEASRHLVPVPWCGETSSDWFYVCLPAAWRLPEERSRLPSEICPWSQREGRGSGATEGGNQFSVSTFGNFHTEAIKLIQTLCRSKSVRLDLDEKKTFNQEMKILSCHLQRGNSLMFSSKSVEFSDNQTIDNNNNPELSVID